MSSEVSQPGWSTYLRQETLRPASKYRMPRLAKYRKRGRCLALDEPRIKKSFVRGWTKVKPKAPNFDFQFALCSQSAALSRIPGHANVSMMLIPVSIGVLHDEWIGKNLENCWIWSLWKRHRFRYSIALQLLLTRGISSARWCFSEGLARKCESWFIDIILWHDGRVRLV